MIKQICVCDRCGKPQDKEVFEITISGKSLNNPFGNLGTSNVLAHNVRETLSPSRHLCFECKNDVEKFIYGFRKEISNE